MSYSILHSVTHVDLMEIYMLDLELIIGMDYLHLIYASIDCRTL